jgi:DNA-binding NarL/FixJ family response regulator
MNRTRVVLADDHALLRSGLRLLINQQRDMVVVGEAGDGHEAIRQVSAHAAHVLCLDLSMPGGGGVKVIERLHLEAPATRVLVLTMHDEPAYLRTVLAAGGHGYLVKTAADTELVNAIRAVRAGRLFIDPSLADDAPAAAPEHADLSTREHQVLVLLAQGHTNQEVADRLFLSTKTVETYRTRVARKLGLRTRAELVRYAIELGLITQDPPSGHG